MTISPSARLTTAQKKVLDGMNVASQKAGGLGSRLDAMQYNGIPANTTGTIAAPKVIKYSLAPALASTTAVHAAITLPASGTTVVTTGITNPDFCRQVTCTGVGAGVTGSVNLIGTDFQGGALTETLTASGTSTIVSTKAFATVTSIEVPVRSTGGETISIGTGAKVGFPVAIPNAGLVIAKSFNAGAVDAGTVTASATLSLSVYASAGTFDNSKVLDLYFLA